MSSFLVSPLLSAAGLIKTYKDIGFMYRVLVITWYGVPFISVLLSPTCTCRSLAIRSDIFQSHTKKLLAIILSQQQVATNSSKLYTFLNEQG